VSVVVALALLRGYKLLISPYFAGSCRFMPSCSDFARDAVIQHGVLRGTWLAARRLVRCHPLGASGFDPVPVDGPSRFESAPEDSPDNSRARVRVCRK
jgi:putative membrane protein insertion efficiency factor